MTLVEVLVSILLLGFVALGVTTLLVISMKQNRIALERSVATGLATGRIDQMAAVGFVPEAEFASYGLPEETAVDGASPTFEALYGEIPGYPDYRRNVRLDYDTPREGMLRVQVDVTWFNRGQRLEKTHSMITYIHPALARVQ